MFVSWLYVSTSIGENSETTAKNMALLSARRNVGAGITGVLMFSGKHFAQYIEGLSDSLEVIKSSICADERHTDVVTLQACQIQNRRFEGWSLAYSGQALYIDNLISRASADYDGRDLLEAMDAFVSKVIHH